MSLCHVFAVKLTSHLLVWQITTPSKRYLELGYLYTKPFYREPWFLVALAAVSVVIVITIIAILCVKSKTYKYKGEGKVAS